MFGDGGGDAFISRLWSLVLLAIVASIAAQLVRVYVVPLLPYVIGIGAVVVVGYLVVSWLRYRRGW